MNLVNEIVASGSYVVSKKTSKSLKALLGSCVGVAIFDEQASVGGLFHILLPEPTSEMKPQDPEKYASTGIPLFLEELRNAGAKVDQMKAFISGGALIGPVSEIDLELDIGGRTSEVVSNMLARENIKIEKVETGGYFGSSISINLANFEITIDPIGVPVNESASRSQTIKIEEIEDAVSRVRPIPQIALKVIRMINSDKVAMATIAGEIRRDQVLSAKVIQLSNSALMSPRYVIESVDHALVLLGERRILLLTLAIFTELYYKESDQGYSLCKGGLYQHAIGVAFISEQLAKLTGVVNPDLAYTAGLLHDIGKTVLDQYVAKEYPFLYRRIREQQSTTLADIEQEMFGINHPEIGRRLATSWELPDSLAEVMANHHQPENSTTNSSLTHIVYLADLLMGRFRAGYSIETMHYPNLADRLKVLNLKPANLPGLIDYIPWNALDTYALTNL